eukprot:14543884-Ditylum_brightwellii.AAC.1
MATQDGKLDSLLVSMVSITKNLITEKDINSLAANNNALMMQVNTLCTQIENIEQTTNTLGSPKSIDPLETVCKYPIKARSTSPPAETHKKWHKSLDK